jgi:hypothetical protein
VASKPVDEFEFRYTANLSKGKFCDKKLLTALCAVVRVPLCVEIAEIKA